MTVHRALTLDEARARAAVVTPQHVQVELVLGLDDFTSRSTITFGAQAGESSFVDIAAVELTEATLNGRSLDPASLDGTRLPLDDLASENTLVVAGRMAYSHDGEGLHRHVDPADGATYLYAMSFLDAAPRWFACFDQPDLKVGVSMTVTTPDESWIVRGNGPAERLGPTQWQWRQHEPLATYFVTLVAGPYAVVGGEHDGIELEVVARASMRGELERHAPDILEVTRLSFDAFHELFGIRYPYGAYVQAFVPDFNAGAMENPGCVTFREQLLFRGAASLEQLTGRASTIAHEMAHQWFGDLVTMQWWDDLWLNESFAEYLAKRVIAERTDLPVWTSFGARKAWGHEADQAPSTHPVAGNGAPDTDAALANFDGISYAKGASLLAQLAARLGEEVFVAGLRDHIASHAGGNATAADLFASWTKAGAHDLDAWVEAWLLTSGMDLLRVRRGDGGAGGGRGGVGAAVVLEREAPGAGEGAPRWRPHTVAVVALDAEGVALERVEVEVADEPVALEFGDVARAVAVVPDATDLSWARLRWADDWALPPIGSIEAASTRVSVLNAMRDGIRHADLDPAVALDLVLPALLVERDSALLGQWIGFAGELAGRASRPQSRPDRGARLAETAAELLACAEPGSDRHLMGLRLVLRTSADETLLRRWLDGEAAPGAEALDQEQRWLAVRRLQELGADVSIIECELERDQTSAGEVAALTAHTSRADHAVKVAALERLVGDADASNHALYALADGLFLDSQHDLTADLVKPWLDGMVASAAVRSGWTLQKVIVGSVPWGHASPATVAALDEVLAQPGGASDLAGGGEGSSEGEVPDSGASDLAGGGRGACEGEERDSGASDLAAPVRRELTDARAKLARLATLHERFA